MSRRGSVLGLGLVISIGGIGAEEVGAETMVFSNEAAFESAAGELFVESFEELTADNEFRVRAEVVLSDFTVSTPFLELSIWDEDAGGAHASDGAQHLQNSGTGQLIDPVPRPTDFDFDEPVGAFGLTVTDWGDFGEGTLSYTDDAGNQFTVATSPQEDGSELFFGVLSDEPFRAVTLSHDISGEGWGMDEVLFAPAPGALHSQLTGLACLGTLASLRRRRTAGRLTARRPRR